MRRYIIISLLLLFFSSCMNKDSAEILSSVFPQFAEYEHKTEFFTSNMYVSPHLILYRGKMSEEDYGDFINNSNYIPNCKEYKGYTYENMRENSFPFDITDVGWWQDIYLSKPDFTGHYDNDLKKFTSCQESRQYKFAFAYKEGYCYLVIENTVSEK